MEGTIKIRDLTIPAEKKRVITYNANSDKAVYHNKNVRKIADNIYVGEVEGDAYYKYCILYAIYGQNVGVVLDRINADCSVEEVIGLVNQHNVGTLDGYMERINQRIEDGQWINILEKEFVRNVKPELIPNVEKARETWQAKLAAERKAREDKRIAEKKAEMEKDNAEAMEIINNAINKIKLGGVIDNVGFTYWIDMENPKEYDVITYLLDKYEIKVPIKTRGFIINSLADVTISDNGKGVRYSYFRKNNSQGSSKLYDLMYELIRKIRNESEG